MLIVEYLLAAFALVIQLLLTPDVPSTSHPNKGLSVPIGCESPSSIACVAEKQGPQRNSKSHSMAEHPPAPRASGLQDPSNVVWEHLPYSFDLNDFYDNPRRTRTAGLRVPPSKGLLQAPIGESVIPNGESQMATGNGSPLSGIP